MSENLRKTKIETSVCGMMCGSPCDFVDHADGERFTWIKYVFSYIYHYGSKIHKKAAFEPLDSEYFLEILAPVSTETCANNRDSI